MEIPYKITIECEKEKDMERIFVDIVKVIKKLNADKKLEGTVKYG